MPWCCMPYAVEITLAAPPSAEEAEPTMYQLPEMFDTVADAKDAAVAHIATLDCDPTGVLYTVQNQEGLTVVVNGERAPDGI